MAKKRSNRFVDFLNNMAGGFIVPKTVAKTTLDTDGETSISASERDALISKISLINGPTITRRGMDSYSRYIRPLTQKIAGIKLDNEAIRILAPEIKTAENIVIPSIMSPTDLKDNEITILSTSKLLNDEQNNRVADLLDKHFNKQLMLSISLPEWIRESLYGAGSKPILVLPITELDIIMNDPNAVLSTTTITSYSNESLTIANHKLNNPNTIDLISIFGIADSSHKTTEKKDHKSSGLEQLRPAIESSITEYISEIGATQRQDKSEGSYNLEAKFKGNGGYKELNIFATEAIENISIVDNPDILKVDQAKKAKKKAEITQKIIVHYKSKALITLNPETKPSVGNPVVYELPPESVIPIFTPGAPTDHIGYFVAIDEYGNPIHVDETSPHKNFADSGRTSPGSLYKSFGFDSHFHIGDHNTSKNEKDALMVNVYQTIIESHLRGRLKNSGFENTYIGAPENVYRCLFARYLSERKTKLLFIPKDFMTYFCFKHNTDGTGRSQIEDIKFILSLKITLMIVRMMASMNSAINRKRLNINFTEEMGDPVQYIELLKKEVVDKSIVNFSYDPSEISRTLAQRSLSVNAKGIPGAENFEVSLEPNEYKNITPDESLMDDIKNMMIFGLDIPPSAANLLAENEYSRSVATNNLFFSRKTSQKQKIVCAYTARYIQTYVNVSQYLKDQIKAIIKGGTTDSKKSDGTIDDTESEKLDDKLFDIIKHIKTSLPSADVAPNKTEFEELDSMIGSITTALEGIFDNDLASDDPIPAIRALVKSEMIRDYMKKIGVSNDADIPDIDSGFLNKLVQFRHILANGKKAMSDIDKNTKPADSPPDDNMGGGLPPDDTGGGIPTDDDTSTGGAPPNF